MKPRIPHPTQSKLFYVKGDAKTILSPELRRYGDYANFIQHRIIVGRMLWQVDDKTERYTILKSDILRQYIPKLILKKLLNGLKIAGLIETNGYWIQGKQSLGYRFKERYAKMPTIRIPCRLDRLAAKIAKKQRSDMGRFTKTHRHLWRWLNRLEIDMAGAQAEIDRLPPDATGKLSLEDYQAICQQAVHAIADKQWEFGTCNYGRIHTNVTRLLAQLRRHLRIDGQALVSIDIANSQPLFLVSTILAGLSKRVSTNRVFPAGFKERLSSPAGFKNKPFQEGERDRVSSFFSGSGFSHFFPSPKLLTYTMSGLAFNSSQNTRYKGFTKDTTPLKSDGIGADFERFKALCESGKLYDNLMAGIGWTAGKDRFKDEEVFRVLYGKNTGYDRHGNWNPSQLQPYLETHFPTVWGYMTGYKNANGYKALSQEMQRQESRLLIEGVCGRLAVEYPDCPVITIHDSIHTFPQWVDTVKRLIHEEFAKLGIRPTLRIEGDGVAAGNIWVQPVGRDFRYSPVVQPSGHGLVYSEPSYRQVVWTPILAN